MSDEPQWRTTRSRAVDAAAGPKRAAELEALVRIPSISADPDRRADVQASAEATAELLRAHGLETVRLAGVEGSHPYVIGEWMHAGADAPTVLLYAHHDVQPPGDRRELGRAIRSSPTSATAGSTGAARADDKAGGGRARARGRRRGSRPAGALPCNVRVLIEGEEEIGSPTLHAFLDAHLDELRSDVLVLADAGNWKVGVPGLTYSLRGLAAADIELRALDGPVHSGMAGGAIPDPVHGAVAGARVAGRRARRRRDRRASGDDVRAADRRRDAAPIAGFDDDAGALRPRDGRAAGRASSSAIPRTTLHERLWLRPSLTVIGIDGHPIKGSSNQIVARASARAQPAARARARIPSACSRSCARTSSARSVGTRAARSARSKARPRGRPTDRSRVRRGAARAARRLRRRAGADGCRRVDPVRRSVRRRVRRHPRAVARPGRSAQSHPRREREPAPRRLAQA